MAHDDYHLMMSMALDGALPAQEDAQLREHLEMCPACQRAWGRMCLADRLFSQAPSAEAPVTLASGVMARVANYEAERRESKPWRLALAIILGLFAVLVGLGFVGIMLLSEGNIANGVTAAVVQGRSVIESLGVAAAVVETLASALVAWLQYLVGQPAVWAAAISALTLASIWIGLLEVLKPAPVPAAVQGS